MNKQERLLRLAEEFRECKKALTAIGDETRQSIIIALIEGESGCEQGIRVGELTQRTHLSRPAVSHHLKVLKDANLIGFSQEGTKNYYYLDILNSDIFKLKKLFDNIDAFITDYQEGETD
ncbi:winged helix-turn-helix transcriptional regulator [Paenibacillus sp. HN-1]|uniref:ArsR/SmtB family transcription factor n=1 Tax=Paenibacillus TaxID=44249 RepID=UPI001CA80370|nr:MULTISPECIES: metalloregulator ArsR/SmtB family transcription factor [Paenibacillus]MBY9080671.1 winged helix-turn-helix transcriptional regulator [Paenibacillus sp. CGMCC 1.18879]MBY9085384.1 winged helix-turn-helix transcriptional regulator [Paenibacillus sinensis]